MSETTEKKTDYYAKDADLLPVPRVYIYGGPQNMKVKLHPVLDRDFLDFTGSRDPAFRAYISKLKYLPCRGEYDLYIEPSGGVGCPCGRS